MLGRTLRLAILTVGASLSVGAATAQACFSPDLDAVPSAGPGDPVGFSVSGIEPGAGWTVSSSTGQTVSGTVSSGSFTMPDLGSQPQTISLSGTVQHSGPGESHPQGAASYPLPLSGSVTVQYVPPPAPPADPPAEGQDPAPAPPAATEPPAQSDPASPPSEQEQATDRGSGAGSGDGNQQEASAADPPSPAGAAAPSARSSGSSAAGQAASGATAGAARGAAAESAVDARAAQGASAADGARANQPRAATDSQRASSGAGLLEETVDVGPVAVPTISLLLTGLVILLGTLGLAAVFFVAGRSMPDRALLEAAVAEGYDETEAELQEIIAEARAAEALGPPHSSGERSRAASSV